jgi:hypothetical protein
MNSAELARELRDQGNKFLKAADALEENTERRIRVVGKSVVRRKSSGFHVRRKLSASGRARISAAQKARWAKIRANGKKKAA